MSAPAIAFGIAGWSFADWKGVVYPRGCKDQLRFCAELVDCIEVNSTFYRTPSARMSASWAQRTEDLPTFFTAKLPQDITHQGRLDATLAGEVCEGFAPLVAAGKLRALLAQFSFRFEDGAPARDYLAQIVDAFAGLAPIVVEVRHKSWAEPEALEALRALGVSVANLDYPGAASGFGEWVCGINGPQRLAYFRLHGRNASAWFRKDAHRDEVYDYLYSPAEVEQVAGRAEQIAADAEQTVVIGNNHYHGKELKLALELKARVNQVRVRVPPTLLAAYPDLGAIAEDPPDEGPGESGEARQGRLFD